MIVEYLALFVVIFLIVRPILNKIFRTNKLPPSPIGLPIIGHFHLLGPIIHRSFKQFTDRYGPIISLRLGSIPCIVISSPELARDFLKTNEQYFCEHNASIAVNRLTYASSVAFAPYGPYFKFIKKLTINELLGTRPVNSFAALRTKERNRFLQLLREKSQRGETVNLTDELPKLSNNIVSQMILGTSNDGDYADEARIVIKEVTKDYFTAGTDTTAITTEWALAELINNPKVLGKARQEIDRVVGKTRLVGESDSPNLPYIQAIIKETLRLHPPLPLLERKCVKQCQIGEYIIPENAMLFVNNWAMARDPKTWESPMDFRPERFLVESNEGGELKMGPIDVKGNNFQLLPFGAGRRMCPGVNLATQMLPALLANIIQCFDLTVPDSQGGDPRAVNDLGVLNMEEAPGFTGPRLHELICLPVPRLGSPLISTIEA
uniref:Cytochrome P450 n=1 Tax=Cannabis sativa TaxID=3483 RepID=A0A803PWD7_CANSA